MKENSKQCRHFDMNVYISKGRNKADAVIIK